MNAERQITIRMPKASLDKWLAALRSGGYSQGRRRLEIGGTYCCLGVLQKCIVDEVQKDHNGFSLAVPTLEWLSQQRIEFTDQTGGLSDVPYLPSLRRGASSANDRGATFAEIADAIEACSEGF